MRRELSSTLITTFLLLLVTCLTLTSGRKSLTARQSTTPTDAYVPGVFPWDPPVRNIGQSVNINTDNTIDYSISLTIVKTVTRASVSFSFPTGVQASSVAVQTDGWTVTFDGTVVNATLDKSITAGTALKVTFRVTLSSGNFVFPTVLSTSCVFNGNPETQTFQFDPTTGPQPTAAPTTTPNNNNFISTAGQSLSTDGMGNNVFTYTFSSFVALSNLQVSFSFPNTNVANVVSTTTGATASFANGVVTVSYTNVVAGTSVSTSLNVTTVGDLTLPNQFTFTTTDATGTPLTQVLTFSSSTSSTAPVTGGPTVAPVKPLGFSHLNHGIKAGRSYLEIAYYLDVTAGSDLDSYYVQFTLPMTVSAAAGDATTTVTLTGTTLKLASSAALAKGAKSTLTAYLKVATYSDAGLPAALDFYYTVAGTEYHTKVKFSK